MNIDDKIQKMLSHEETSLDVENFLENFHSAREKRAGRTQRISYGVSSLIVVLLVGVLLISQIGTNGNGYLIHSEIKVTDEELDEYYDDMMVYFVEESNDVWSAMEFFYENEDEIEN